MGAVFNAAAPFLGWKMPGLGVEVESKASTSTCKPSAAHAKLVLVGKCVGRRRLVPNWCVPFTARADAKHHVRLVVAGIVLSEEFYFIFNPSITLVSIDL